MCALLRHFAIVVIKPCVLNHVFGCGGGRDVMGRAGCFGI